MEFCNNLLLLLIKRIPVKSFLFVHTTLFEVVNWSFNSHPRENSIFSNLISIWQFRKKKVEEKKKTWFSKVGYKTIYKEICFQFGRHDPNNPSLTQLSYPTHPTLYEPIPPLRYHKYLNKYIDIYLLEFNFSWKIKNSNNNWFDCYITVWKALLKEFVIDFPKYVIWDLLSLYVGKLQSNLNQWVE